MAVALIVAAGRGERLGFGGPKALATVAGRPMLEWSLEALRQVPAVTEIVVALPADRLDAAPEGTVAVAGGATRSESVLAALQASTGGGDPVIVHDAARPLVRADNFVQALAIVNRAGVDAVVAATPVADTIKQTGGEHVASQKRPGVSDLGAPRVTRTLDRRGLWAVQTPQVFRRRVLEQVLVGADGKLLEQATDDAWLVEQAGGCVVVLPSPAENFKVTTRLDLHLAELLLGERSGCG
jgi:2-C-methyl-D-erythritol 4-phosphate cytidylyltransferase